MRVAEFMDRALYAPDTGFYETGGRAGRRGASFVTSPEVGPLFGAVLADWIAARWSAGGEPAHWTVVDAGAGPATLTTAMRVALGEAHPAVAERTRWIALERTAAQRALHPAGIESAADLVALRAAVADLGADVIIANELLDNLPVDLLEATPTGWLPVTVAPDGTTTPDAGGRRIPVATAAAAWIVGARRLLAPGGVLVCFDYADTTPALADRPWTEWLRAFAGHDRVEGPFLDPGTRDVTVVVPHDQLPSPSRTSRQGAWLREQGIDALVGAGQAEWEANAARPDVRALRMRSRTIEAAALTDPDGLGAFWVGEWDAG